MELGPLPDPAATYSLRVTRCNHVGDKPLQTDSCVCVNHRARFERDGVYGEFILSLSLSFLYDLFLFSLFACRPRISRRRLSSYFSFFIGKRISVVSRRRARRWLFSRNATSDEFLI